MAEIVAKSKASKRERAKEKEEDDDQLEELDNVFKSLADVCPSVAARFPAFSLSSRAARCAVACAPPLAT
jgi:hypothetical protein